MTASSALIEKKGGSDVKVLKKFGINIRISILLWKVSIVAMSVSSNTTIKEILDKLKKFFERNIRNILKTWTTNFWNILIMT